MKRIFKLMLNLVFENLVTSTKEEGHFEICDLLYLRLSHFKKIDSFITMQGCSGNNFCLEEHFCDLIFQSLILALNKMCSKFDSSYYRTGCINFLFHCRLTSYALFE